MTPAPASHRAVGKLLICLLILAALFAAPATAKRGPRSAGDLSARLAELATPSLRSAPPARQAAKLDLAPHGGGSLLRQGGRVLAYVRFADGALAGIRPLRSAGARIVDVSRRYRTVTVAARPAALPEIASVAGVAGVIEALAPVTAATCPSGDAVSEGLTLLKAGDGAEEARNVFAVDGSGIAVGILSDSFDQATEAADGSGPVATTAEDDVATADLPGTGNECGHTTPVEVLEEDKSVSGEGPSDEGRAMAQIVHDLAPGASLDFASAFNGEISFANNVEALAEGDPDVVGDGAKVIVDDVFYLEEPFFQDGPIAVAVDKVVGAGVAYFSAAGNNNLIDAEGHDIASWEAPSYRDAGGCPQEVQQFPGANGMHCMDFNPGSGVDRTFGLRVPPGTLLTLDLQWSEPWLGVATDLDAYLLDFSGDLIALSLEDNIQISQKPVEVLQWKNDSASTRTVQIVVNRFKGSNPRLKLGLLGNGAGVTATEYPRSTEDVVGPTIFGHSGSSSAISTGAVGFDKAAPEEYSSRGPVRHDFEPFEGPEAAEPLPVPEILSKPDIVATDCGVTTFFSHQDFFSSWRFCGTSAAAPHAAGVAALMLEEEPASTPGQIRAALQSSAVPVGTFGACAIGAGLVEAVGAIEDVLAPPAFTPPTCSPPASEGSPEEAQAAGDWGSETPPAPPSGDPPSPPSQPPPTLPSPDTRAPRTFIQLRPAKVVRTSGRTAKVVFRFGADEPEVTFACKLDTGFQRFCDARLVRRVGLGWHVVRVRARDAAGNVDSTPAVYRFKVERFR
jgi:Subtilase family